MYILLTDNDMKVSERKINKGGVGSSSKYLYVSIIASPSGSGISNIDILYSYGSHNNRIEAKFSKPDPSRLISIEASNLLDKLKLIIITYSSKQLGNVLSNTEYIGITNLQKYIYKFVGCYALTLALYLLMSHNDNDIGNPFTYLNTTTPLMEMSIDNIVNNNMNYYNNYYTKVISPMKTGSIGKRLLEQSKVFYDTWGEFLPNGKVLDNSEALHSSIIGMSKYMDDKMDKLLSLLNDTEIQMFRHKEEISDISIKSMDNITNQQNKTIDLQNIFLSNFNDLVAKATDEISNGIIDIKNKCTSGKEMISIHSKSMISEIDSKVSTMMDAFDDQKNQSTEEILELKEKSIETISLYESNHTSKQKDAFETLRKGIVKELDKHRDDGVLFYDSLMGKLTSRYETLTKNIDLVEVESTEKIESLVSDLMGDMETLVENVIGKIQKENIEFNNAITFRINNAIKKISDLS